jgi:hypothetical protein
MNRVDRFDAGRAFGDDRDLGVLAEQRPQMAPRERLVVDNDRPYR